MLRREVPCRRRPDLSWLVRIAVTASVAIGGATWLLGPRMIYTTGESKQQVAKMVVQRYAYEAYAEWSAAHPDELCPRRLADLNEYMNNKDTRDPWGANYLMFCGRMPALSIRGIAVLSAGEDGQFGTPDDVRSWE